MSQNANGSSESSGIEYVVLAVIVCFALAAVWKRALPHVGVITHTLLYPWFAFSAHFSQESSVIANWMTSHRGNHDTTQQWMIIMNTAGKALRWPVCLGLGWIAYGTWSNSVRRKYKRKMNFYQLSQVQSRTFSMILPAVRSKLSGNFRNDPKDPWRSALSPQDFVEEHHLYQHKSETGHYILDDEKILYHYASELTPFVSMGAMSRVRRLMVALCIEWILGGYEDEASARGGGSPLTRAANEGFWPYDLKGPSWAIRLFLKNGCDSYHDAPITQLLGKIVQRVPRVHMDIHVLDQADRVLDNEEAMEIFKSIWDKHYFEETIILALWNEANRYMKLPTASFTWLRPLDRKLWYALNSMGRPGAWAESNGIVAHYRFEVTNGKTQIPYVQPSLTALKDVIDQMDYLDETTKGVEDIKEKESEKAFRL